MNLRKAAAQRATLETRIEVAVNLDGAGASTLRTGLPFLEHMLAQTARHGLLDLEVVAEGDLHIDAHHTVEDIGITLGQAFSQALGDKGGVRRYGHAYAPLDEALCRAAVDLSGRPGLYFNVDFPAPLIGASGFAAELFREFFQGFVNHAGVTLHLDALRGRNGHHIAEALFKAFGLALRAAVEIDPRRERSDGAPSTKGSL